MSSKSGGTKSSRKEDGVKVVADNRRARFDYEIIDTYEASIELMGPKVKSLRSGKANIAESYAAVRDGELFLVNAYIPEYRQANRFNHETKRPRRLLLHAREIDKLSGGVLRDGLTIVPLRVYFNARGMAKVGIALAKGKKLHDKREKIKERSWDREKARLLREKG